MREPHSEPPKPPRLLAELTTLRVGGPAARLVEAESTDELVEAVCTADRTGEPVLVLGGGSNLVAPDAGVDATVVLVRTHGVEVERDGDEVAVTVAAGEPWDALVARAVDEGWAGIEALSGIPGLAGATPMQNVGAYGQEVAQTVRSVRVLDRHEGAVRELSVSQCRFGYRTSLLKGSDRYVVLAVTFAFVVSPRSRPVRYAELARSLGVAAQGQAPLADVRAAVLELRRGKGMVLDPADHDTWSAGSFFTNPVLDPAAAAALPAAAPRWAMDDGRDGSVKTSAAWLIEAAGFPKGYGEGPARLSTKHSLAITNRGGARAADVLALAREVRDTVRQRFGVTLRNEPVILGQVL